MDKPERKLCQRCKKYHHDEDTIDDMCYDCNDEYESEQIEAIEQEHERLMMGWFHQAMADSFHDE